MIIGESRVTNMVLRMLGNDTRYEIDNYVNDVCSRDFLVMQSIEQVNGMFGKSMDNFLASLSEDDLLNLRTWSGFNYVNINAILRGNWTYEKNGILTDEKANEFKKLSNMISNLISKFSKPNLDFITFRGTTISSFASYGINELSQLENLVGKFLYEQGFTSTSLLVDSSFLGKNFKNGEIYNVEIRYLIPSESNDGVLLLNDNTSHLPEEKEYLLDKGSLSKVIDVSVDKVKNTAILTVVLVPKKIYEITYNKDNGIKK